MDTIDLTEREKSILRHIIQQFIMTANPVGSRNISKKFNVGLSPASIRNIMSDLEEIGLLDHPHTSAGRIPTDRGYRLYVDSLMKPGRLNKKEIDFIDTKLESDYTETEELLQITSAILSSLTNHLACVTYPRFDNAILSKIQIVALSSTRIMVILSIHSGLVRTITLEINIDVTEKSIKDVEKLLNEKMAGLSFSEIRNSFEYRIRDFYQVEYKPLIRVFIDSIDKIFTDIKKDDKTVLTGVKNILKQPEFDNHAHLQSIIELIEDKEVIVHIMDSSPNFGFEDVAIVIGGESKNEKLSDYSLITKNYSIGHVNGRVGIIGPKRMEYSKVIAAVVYVAEMLTNEFKKQTL